MNVRDKIDFLLSDYRDALYKIKGPGPSYNVHELNGINLALQHLNWLMLMHGPDHEVPDND